MRIVWWHKGQLRPKNPLNDTSKRHGDEVTRIPKSSKCQVNEAKLGAGQIRV